MQHRAAATPADSAPTPILNFTILLPFASFVEQEDLKPKAEQIEKAVACVIPQCHATLIGTTLHCSAPTKPSATDLVTLHDEIQKLLPESDFATLKPFAVEDDVTELEFGQIEAALQRLQDLRDKREKDPKYGETDEFKKLAGEARNDVELLERKLKSLTQKQGTVEEGVFDVLFDRAPPEVPNEWPLAKSFAELNLNTGDVILFAGTHKKSVWIRQVQWSRYSHAAIVVKSPDNGLHILQSNGDHGVTFDDLEKYVSAYDGRVVVRRLTVPDALRTSMTTAMDAFRKYTLGDPYTGKLDFVFMYFETVLRGKGIKEKKAWFCSQLVAQAYIEMGLLKCPPLPSVYVPERFAHDCPMKLPLLQGAALADPIRLPNKF